MEPNVKLSIDERSETESRKRQLSEAFFEQRDVLGLSTVSKLVTPVSYTHLRAPTRPY